MSNKTLNWGVSFKRETPYPLDKSSLFDNKTDFENYIKGSLTERGLPYVGQIVSLIDGDVIETYQINKTGETYNYTTIGTKVIDSESIYLTEDIYVAGLDDTFGAGNYENGDVIVSGTTLQTILTNFLCKEIYPIPTYDNGSYTLKINSPVTITNTSDISNNSIVEVGTEIQISKVSAKDVSVEKKPSVVGNLINGYSETINGDIINNDIIESVASKTGENGYFSLTPSVTGFTNYNTTVVTGNTASDTFINPQKVVVEIDDNVLSIKENAPTHSYNIPSIESKYIVSNLNKRLESKKTNTLSAITQNASATAKTGEFKVTGVYPMFCNGVTASTISAEAVKEPKLETPTNKEKLPLVKTGNQFAISFAQQSETSPYTIYVYSGLTINSALKINGLTNNYDSDCTDLFIEEDGVTTFQVQGKTINYHTFKYSGTEGPNKVLFTLKKR